MFDLISKANEEIEVLSFGWISIAEVLLETFGQVPMLGIAVDLDVANASPRLPYLALVPRPSSSTIEDCMKKGAPCHHYEYDELRCTKPRTWSVVRIDRPNCSRAALCEIFFDALRKSLWQGVSVSRYRRLFSSDGHANGGAAIDMCVR